MVDSQRGAENGDETKSNVLGREFPLNRCYVAGGAGLRRQVLYSF
jgi:hypothetical protein